MVAYNASTEGMYGNNVSWSVQDVIDVFKASLYTYRDPQTIVLIVCYVIIFMLAVAGNILVLIVILSHKTMRSVTNYFLLNLAIADVLVTLVCIPLTVGEIVYKEWAYGIFMCKTAAYLQGVSVSASVLTITALSLDRYVVIRHPVRSRSISTTGHAKKALCIIWMMSTIIMIPLLIIRHLTVNTIDLHFTHEYTLVYCHENWPSPQDRLIYDVFLFVFIYVVPGVAVVVSYWITGCHLLMGAWAIQRQGSDVHQSTKVVAGRRRVARMLLIVALLFAISWMPYYICLLYMDFHHDQRGDSLSALSFALLLGHSHSAQNPIIYCIMNSKFKRGMAAALKCRKMSSSDLTRGDTLRSSNTEGNNVRLAFRSRSRYRAYGGVDCPSSSPSANSSTYTHFQGSTRRKLVSTTSEEDSPNTDDVDSSVESSPWRRRPAPDHCLNGRPSLRAVYVPNGQCVNILPESNEMYGTTV